MLMKKIKIVHINVLQIDTSVSCNLLFGIFSKFVSTFTNFASSEKHFNLEMYVTKGTQVGYGF